jgi:hypothetical protein
MIELANTEPATVPSRYPLGSCQWLERFCCEAQALLDRSDRRLDAPSWSVVELFTGAPDSALPGDQLDAGYRMTVREGVVRVIPGVRKDDVGDVRITLDWEAACQMAAMSSGPELSAVTASHLAAGRIRVIGDLRKSPIPFPILHDRMVAWTEPTSCS